MDQYNVIGENTLTGNTWLFEGPVSLEEAMDIRSGAKRLEADYKIEYYIQKV